MLLQELANYRKRDTGLSMNIWIDGYQTYRKGKHYKKLKFQINKSNNIELGEAQKSLLEIFSEKELKYIYNFDIKEVQEWLKNKNKKNY